MSHITEITDTDFEREVLKSETPVLVDFWAPWCMPCRMLSPILDKLASQFEGQVKFVKINTDDNPLTPGQYEILGIPTVMIFHNGQILDTQVGVLPPEQLKAFIEKAIPRQN